MGTTKVTGADKEIGEAAAFFDDTDITGAEAETLTDGSNADELHTHDKPEITVSFAAFDEWTIADGIVGDTTETEVADAHAVVDDGGSQALLSAAGGEGGYTANYQLFPDAEQVNDAVYFGGNGDGPFAVLEFDVDTVATYGDDSLTWEYWDGDSWATLTIAHDNTDTTAQNGKRSFQQDGRLIFIPPSDWASTTVNGQAAYWIRARVSGANITQIPVLNGVNHKIVSPTSPARGGCEGSVTGIRVTNGNASLHSNADVKFFVFHSALSNSGEQTWAQDKRTFYIDEGEGLTPFDIDYQEASGDLCIIVTQEDGVDNPTNVLVELTVVPD